MKQILFHPQCRKRVIAGIKKCVAEIFPLFALNAFRSGLICHYWDRQQTLERGSYRLLWHCKNVVEHARAEHVSKWKRLEPNYM